MFEAFTQYLKINTSLTEAEIEQIESYMVTRKVDKNQYLLREGEISILNCFVTKGCLRLYHVDEQGNEHILKFAVENWWISDYESYNTGNPSKCNIDALEDSELLLIHKSDMDALTKTILGFQNFKEKLDSRSFNATQNRILSTISNSAEGRYENFISTYPNIMNRVPLRMIASYLGLTRETLSRVRRKITK